VFLVTDACFVVYNFRAVTPPFKDKMPVSQVSFNKDKQVNMLASASMLLTLVFYAWLASFGLFNHLPTITAYYDKLATAFTHGSLALEEQPDPALLSLSNPFDRSQWRRIDVPTDYSLYEGKYYLYFGPVPAVMLTIGKFLGFGTKGDQYPAFLFICGIFVVQALLLLWVWKRYFANLAVWLVPLGIFFVGSIAPFPWILTRARFFEAANTGGQFFFLLGLYLLLIAQTRDNLTKWKLLAAGTSWALAMGSRPTQVFPMGITVLMFAVLEYGNYLRHKQILKSLYPFMQALIPFVIGLSILGWYNWARFDSPFEFGFSYQLAGPDIQRYSKQLFSHVYVLPNFYNYVLNQPTLIERFPLINSVEGVGQSLFPSIALPPIYYTGNITGILYSTPFVLFAAVLLFPRKKQTSDSILNNMDSFCWVVLLFTGIFLAEFIPFVSYFWVETRFFADFTPPLAILGMIGFWRGFELLRDRPVWRSGYTVLGVVLIVFSILMGIALGLSAHWEAFKEFNPVLWKAMYRNFQPGLWKTLYDFFVP
jgi:hypothetical protein